MTINAISSSLTNDEENLIKKKKKKKKSKDDSELTIDENAAKEHHRRNLIEDNEIEDAQIKKLEKLLGIKPDKKTYLKDFIDDGLDYLLDFCDKDQRKQILLAEGDGEGNVWYDDQDEDQQWLAKKQKEQVELANQAENSDSNIKQQKTKKKRTPTVVKFNEQIQTKIIDDDDQSIEDEDDFDEEDFDEEDFDDEKEEEEETPVAKEDIYGRTIDVKGNVIKNASSTVYIPPALRQKFNTSDDNSIVELKRRLQGQLNRLSEKNLPSILIEIETLYRSQSCAITNSCLYELYQDSLLSSLSLKGDSLLAEHALLACLLHANVGIEIGSYLLENFSEKLTLHINDDISNKINDNLIIFLSYLYAFYMTNGKILFDIVRYLLNIDQLNEKRLELILLLLKTCGFILRKDNPLELKKFLQELRTSCSSSTLLLSSSKRLEFMMDTIKSLKNNDIRKLPGGFEPERIDRLRKIYRNLIKDKTVQQTNILNVSLQDFLNAKEQGRWWIVGSAWQKQTSHLNNKNNILQKNDQQFNDTIKKLAKQQHMNTDIRRLIFGTLLTSENFNFIELTPLARTFLVELFVKLFNDTDDTSLKHIFQFPSTQNYKFVKDAFRLFLSHLILKKSNYSELIHRRCQIAINQLSIE